MLIFDIQLCSLLLVLCAFSSCSGSNNHYAKARGNFYQHFKNVGILFPEKDNDFVKFSIREDQPRVIQEPGPVFIKDAGKIDFLTDIEKKPKFCNGLDCPDFKVVSKTKDYEERQYRQTRWVSTSLTGVDLDKATNVMFERLFEYISGKNVKKEKIDMTAPVIISIIPGQGPACENNFTMSFFISTSLADPPQPSDPTVFLSILRRQNVFVRSFGGFTNKEKWLKNAEALVNSLIRDGKKFKSGSFYSAGYDSPFKILDRHNEIWYIAQK